MSSVVETVRVAASPGSVVSITLGVGEGRPEARAGLDHDLVATFDEFAHTRGTDRDAVLVVLDLGGIPTFMCLLN